MNVWTIVVLVVGFGYVLDRVSSTTDVPVSRRLAAARELVERGRSSGGLAADPDGRPPARPQPRSRPEDNRAAAERHRTPFSRSACVGPALPPDAATQRPRRGPRSLVRLQSSHPGRRSPS
jgi:hypothetical protein